MRSAGPYGGHVRVESPGRRNQAGALNSELLFVAFVVSALTFSDPREIRGYPLGFSARRCRAARFQVDPALENCSG